MYRSRQLCGPIRRINVLEGEVYYYNLYQIESAMDYTARRPNNSHKKNNSRYYNMRKSLCKLVQYRSVRLINRQTGRTAEANIAANSCMPTADTTTTASHSHSNKRCQKCISSLTFIHINLLIYRTPTPSRPIHFSY